MPSFHRVEHTDMRSLSIPLKPLPAFAVRYQNAAMTKHTATHTSKSHDVDISLVIPDLGLLCCHPCLGDREDAIHTERDTDAGDLVLAGEHANEVVITATRRNTANTDGGVIRTVVVFASL